MRRFFAVALVVAVFATAFTLGFVVAPQADAMTKCGTQFKFYSDATLTTQVGAMVWWPESCACYFHSWGSTTVYRVVEDATCFD